MTIPAAPLGRPPRVPARPGRSPSLLIAGIAALADPLHRQRRPPRVPGAARPRGRPRHGPTWRHRGPEAGGHARRPRDRVIRVLHPHRRRADDPRPSWGSTSARRSPASASPGIAVGFGAQSLVKDYFNGALILLENQFANGDVVSVAGVSGHGRGLQPPADDGPGPRRGGPHGAQQRDQGRVEPDPDLGQRQPRRHGRERHGRRRGDPGRERGRGGDGRGPAGRTTCSRRRGSSGSRPSASTASRSRSLGKVRAPELPGAPASSAAGCSGRSPRTVSSSRGRAASCWRRTRWRTRSPRRVTCSRARRRTTCRRPPNSGSGGTTPDHRRTPVRPSAPDLARRMARPRVSCRRDR